MYTHLALCGLTDRSQAGIGCSGGCSLSFPPDSVLDLRKVGVDLNQGLLGAQPECSFKTLKAALLTLLWWNRSGYSHIPFWPVPCALQGPLSDLTTHEIHLSLFSSPLHPFLYSSPPTFPQWWLTYPLGQPAIARMTVVSFQILGVQVNRMQAAKSQIQISWLETAWSRWAHGWHSLNQRIPPLHRGYSPEGDTVCFRPKSSVHCSPHIPDLDCNFHPFVKVCPSGSSSGLGLLQACGSRCSSCSSVRVWESAILMQSMNHREVGRVIPQDDFQGHTFKI